MERHSNGTIYVFWYDAVRRRSRRESLRTKDLEEGKLAFAEFLQKGPFAERFRRRAGLTVVEALDIYFETHVAHRVVDKDRQRHAIAHLKAFFGDATLIKDVDAMQSRLYADARARGRIGGARRQRKSARASTVRRELNVLVAAANHAVKWKRLPADDVPRIELPKDNRRSQEPWLTKDQLRKLIDLANANLLQEGERGHPA